MRLLALACCVLWAVTCFAQAPPVGGNQPVQATKTGSYTVKSTDLKTQIPFNCAAPCTVTMPASTASWPKGYPITILNSGTTTVTIHATSPSSIYGMPLTGADLQLTNQGNYAVLTADKANNYAAYGITGSGTVVAGTHFMLLHAGGHVLLHSGGAIVYHSF